MVIGIDASRANHNQRTGVEEYAFQLIQSWKTIIPENVRVILYTDKPLQGDLAILPTNWTQKVLSWSPRRLWTQIRLSWEMLSNAPDILFIPAHVFPLIHPRKTVMTVHDIAAVRFPESYNRFERWYSVWSAKYAVKKLWQVIVPSEFVKKEMLVVFGSKNAEKIKVIYHGYKSKKFQIDEVLNKYKITKPFLLSIGRLEEKKNTVNIIKAFNGLKLKNDNLQLVLVGKPGYGYEKVEETIENSPYKKDIIIPGWVDGEDLPSLMKNSEVFVFPSLYEGFGLPILEAFAFEIPVVTSFGSCLEEIGGEACLYVESQNVSGIANAIKEILDNPELKNRLIHLGKERLQNFGWEKSAQKTWDVVFKS